MASSLDPNNFPESRMRVHDSRSLGPSDSSDSGSDLAGHGLTEDDVLSLDSPPDEDAEMEREKADAVDLDDSSDRHSAGVRSTAGRSARVRVRDAADRDADRIMNPEEPGLGDGLDQAEEEEEAELGLADEEIDEEDDDNDRQ
jgi:hypothetical protein